LHEVLDKKFDIVFTSYGVIHWLSNLRTWGKIISSFLKPGGIFYMVELHPLMNVFADETTDLKVAYPYFHSSEPLKVESTGIYADPTKELSQKVSYQWLHTLSDVINAISQADMKLEFLHEFPYLVYQKFPFMEQCDEGWWRLKNGPDIPLLFSMQAVKI